MKTILGNSMILVTEQCFREVKFIKLKRTLQNYNNKERHKTRRQKRRTTQIERAFGLHIFLRCLIIWIFTNSSISPYVFIQIFNSISLSNLMIPVWTIWHATAVPVLQFQMPIMYRGNVEMLLITPTINCQSLCSYTVHVYNWHLKERHGKIVEENTFLRGQCGIGSASCLHTHLPVQNSLRPCPGTVLMAGWMAWQVRQQKGRW